MEIEERILKDIRLFDSSIEKAGKLMLGEEENKVVELAKMYALDSKSWLDKKDYYTSFSSIAYAHGLLDAILKMRNIIE
jgi:hypothetical protein